MQKVVLQLIHRIRDVFERPSLAQPASFHPMVPLY